MEVPQRKNAMDRSLWREEVLAFRDAVEALSGTKVTADRLRREIGRVNRKRKALQRVNEFRSLDEPPISGLDALLVSQTALNMDVDAFCKAAEALGDELQERERKGTCSYEKAGKRVLLAGTPSPMGSAKVHYVVETSGMRIVADESCTGVRYYRDLVDDSPEDLDGLLDAVADRYFRIDCACFSPNSERIENAVALAREYRVQGVVHNVLQYCHGFNVEAKALEIALLKIGLPSLKLVTDYAEQDVENLRVRAQAFSEMLGAPAAPAACAVPAPGEKKKG
jgi:benzoyl-CoA reductase/2-hydroxyglutaryl-CoA dehydratase subunit BcrC/BadD/HgdB